MANDDYRILRPQGRRIATELEGMPPLHLDVRAGEAPEPVLGHQDSVPGGANAHDVNVAFGSQDCGYFPCPGRVPVQHLGHGLGLIDDGVVHEVGVGLPDFLLKGHGVLSCGSRIFIFPRIYTNRHEWGIGSESPTPGQGCLV